MNSFYGLYKRKQCNFIGIYHKMSFDIGLPVTTTLAFRLPLCYICDQECYHSPRRTVFMSDKYYNSLL